MLICNTCYQKNDDGSPACTTCGAPLNVLAGQATYIDTGGPGPQPPAVATPPAPMANPAWSAAPPPVAQPMVVIAGGGVAGGGFRCPYCNSQFPPRVQKKISTGGWIVFAVLAFTCLPLCWIGLLMTEEQRVCSSCGCKLG